MRSIAVEARNDELRENPSAVTAPADEAETSDDEPERHDPPDGDEGDAVASETGGDNVVEVESV